MSRHIFETDYKGEKVQIVAGWDRPLQGFFMTIEKVAASNNDDDDNFIYNNLNEENSHPRTFDPFIGVLVDLGINIPKQMIDEIVEDGIFNTGNKDVVHYFEDGAYKRKQLYPAEISRLPAQSKEIAFKKVDDKPMMFFDPIWEPLEKVLGRDACRGFMFMASYQLEDGTIIHTYKNINNRAYINLSDDLRAWEYTGGGYKELTVDFKSKWRVGRSQV